MSLLLANSAGAASDNALIPLLIALPLVAMVAILILPAKRGAEARQIAVLGSVLTGALSIYLLTKFSAHSAEMQFEVRRDWIADAGISWHFGVDGISLLMVVLTGVLFPLAILGARPPKDSKAYHAWIMLLMSGTIGVFCALDLVLFFAFFEIVLVPMYFLIGMWGHGNRRYAANKFFLYTMVGSALMLVGMLALVALNNSATGRITFDVVELAQSQSISVVAGRWIFVAFALAFAIKVPLFPLHTWLPDAHTEAPTAGSVILAGVMLKLGTYGLLRFGLYLFPEAARFFAPVMMTLAVIGIVYGAVVATMQRDLKRLVAYSSVAHMGFIVLGIFSLTIQGLSGGVLQMVNHGISTPALFLLVGWIYERRHTREISELSGLQQVAPVFAGVFTLVMMSSIGVPGLNGFVGEYLSLLGAWETFRWWAVVAAVGVILAALYLLWAYQRVFHGPVTEPNRSFRELRLSEGLVIAPLLALILVLGLYPKVALDRIEPSVRAVLAQVDASSDEELTVDGPTPTESGSSHGGANAEDGE
jgi:NADH-quinone oxidoreductase subunit M